MADKNEDSDLEGVEEETEPQMTEEEIFASVTDKILNALKDFDQDGAHPGLIKTDNLKDFLEFCSFKMEDQQVYKIASDLDPSQSGYLDGVDLKNLIVYQEIERLTGNDESELLDAYVAMGGEADGGGCVDATKLIKTIKEDF